MLFDYMFLPEKYDSSLLNEAKGISYEFIIPLTYEEYNNRRNCFNKYIIPPTVSAFL